MMAASLFLSVESFSVPSTDLHSPLCPLLLKPSGTRCQLNPFLWLVAPEHSLPSRYFPGWGRG